MFQKLRPTITLAISLVIMVCDLSRSAPAHGAATKPATEGVACRVMESFEDDRLGVRAIVFHQRDKAEGPRLGALLLAHSGDIMEIETADGHRHRATVFRVKSCFGRGLLLVQREIKLVGNDEFILRLQERN